jgi:hypothetical protein
MSALNLWLLAGWHQLVESPGTPTTKKEKISKSIWAKGS